MTVQLIRVHTRTLPVVYNRIHSLDVSVSHVFIGHADHELPPAYFLLDDVSMQAKTITTAI